VLSLLLCFLGFEIVLRIWGPEYRRPHAYPFYPSNPRGYFEEFGEVDGVESYIVYDQFWERGQRRVPDDMTSEKELQTFLDRETDILALGDSFTYGLGVRYDDTYSRELEELLAGDNQPLLINNLSVPGNDIEEICAIYEEVRQPDQFPLVIYGLVLNDFGLPGAEKIVGSDYIDLNNGGYAPSHWRELSASINFIGHCLDTIRTDRVTKKAYLAAFQGENSRKHFAMLADLDRQVEADGGELVIVLFPLLHRFDDYPFQGLHDKIDEFCEREGVPILDLLPAYSQHEAEDLWVHPVDHHPNEIAHRIAADELFAFLNCEDLLPPRRAADRETLALESEASTE